ncbi:hypothetical protein HNR39_000653 [Glaciimonas immobilis]|uniref:Uncharacterized protein n=1 Tax=Glaciimonas immobilis TaxID=728004 RepID=A0A840RM56_9BURK|nr:hypothetical protein [Glaciimonas immobilis]
MKHTIQDQKPRKVPSIGTRRRPRKKHEISAL